MMPSMGCREKVGFKVKIWIQKGRRILDKSLKLIYPRGLAEGSSWDCWVVDDWERAARFGP
jgi:hypothetical protein